MEAFRGGGQIAQVVGLAAVGQGAQILAAIAAGNGHTPDASLLGQGHALPLGEHTAVGEFVAGNFSVLAYQAGDGFGVLVGDGVHNVDVGGEVPDPAMLFFHSAASFQLGLLSGWK